MRFAKQCEQKFNTLIVQNRKFGQLIGQIALNNKDPDQLLGAIIFKNYAIAYFKVAKNIYGICEAETDCEETRLEIRETCLKLLETTTSARVRFFK